MTEERRDLVCLNCGHRQAGDGTQDCEQCGSDEDWYYDPRHEKTFPKKFLDSWPERKKNQYFI